MTQAAQNVRQLKIRKKNQSALIGELMYKLLEAFKEDKRIDAEIKELMTKEVGDDT